MIHMDCTQLHCPASKAAPFYNPYLPRKFYTRSGVNGVGATVTQRRDRQATSQHSLKRLANRARSRTILFGSILNHVHLFVCDKCSMHRRFVCPLVISSPYRSSIYRCSPSSELGRSSSSHHSAPSQSLPFHRSSD